MNSLSRLCKHVHWHFQNHLQQIVTSRVQSTVLSSWQVLFSGKRFYSMQVLVRVQRLVQHGDLIHCPAFCDACGIVSLVSTCLSARVLVCSALWSVERPLQDQASC